MMLRQGLSLLSVLSIVMCSNVFAADGKKLDGTRVQVDLTNDFMLPDSARLTMDDCLCYPCNALSSSAYDPIPTDPNDTAGFPGLNQIDQTCGVTDGPLFSNPEYKTGNAPVFVATGDLNNDGAVDLIVVNFKDENLNALGEKISILLSLGDGTFADEVQYKVGELPRSVAIGDYDGDGDLDLAVSNQHNRRGYPKFKGISLLLNRGDGTFEDQVFIEAGDHPWAIVSGDLDGDGDLDLAVANANSDNISVLLNNGDATFADQVLYDTGDGPLSIAMGDIDGDGILDLGTSNMFSDDISILINHGDGTFGSATQIEGTFFEPRSIVFGDLDDDNDVDLAVVDRLKGIVSVHKNRGDGTFAPEVQYSTGDARYGNTPYSLALGDLNHDGMLDLVVANSNLSFDGFLQLADDNVSFLLNRGDGTFDDFISIEAGITPFSVSVADLDGDGHLDVAVANLVGDSVSILRNLNKHIFGTDVVYPTGNQPHTVAMGDLDGDGDLDLAVAVEGSQGRDGGVTVFLNIGDGMYVDGVRYVTGQSFDVAIGDLDGDNDLDIVVAGYRAHVLLNNGDGTYVADATYLAGNHRSKLVLGDFDGDKDLDFAVSNTTKKSISILLNVGNGTFADGVLYDTGTDAGQLAIGDLDGDGHIDLVSTVRGDYGIARVFYNRGDGTFEGFVLFGKGSSSTDLAIGDVNNDGKLDLVFVIGRLRVDVNNVSILYNQGNRKFSDEVSFTAGRSPSAVAIGDLDGDGDADLAIANVDGANISVLRNLGNLDAGYFEKSELYGVGDHPFSVAIGDLDGDGDNDIATANFGDFFRDPDEASSVSVLLHVNAPDDDDDGLSNACDSCPASDLAGTVVIGPCDSGVVNELDGFGCTMSDSLSACPTPSLLNRDYFDCVEAITGAWFSEGKIQHAQRKHINQCAHRALVREATSIDIARRAVKNRSQR